MIYHPRRSFLRRVLFAALLLCGTADADAQVFDLPTVVETLASDEHAGRLAGSGGERLATDFLAAQLQRVGARPAFEDRAWFQAVPLAEPLVGEGRNVAGVLAATNSRADAPIVLLSAHHDHLGDGRLVGSSARMGEVGRVHRGADDNASGVAVCLRTAERLAARPDRDFDVLVVFFTAEETDRQGARRFVQHPPVALDRIVLAINFDQVGRLGESLGFEVASPVPQSRLTDDIDAASELVGLPLEPSPGLIRRTDAGILQTAGVPVLALHTGTHQDTHRPTDTPDLIDYAGMERIAAFAASTTIHRLPADSH